jgi:hypothetical protein
VGGRAERQREQGRLLDRLFERSGEGERDLDLVEMGFVAEVEGGREEGRKEVEEEKCWRLIVK